MKKVRSTDPKGAILDAAKEVFAKNGYRGGSLNEIAEISGYSRAGILHHFPSKEAILLALLDRRDEELIKSTNFSSKKDLGIEELLTTLPDILKLIMQDRPLISLAHSLNAEAAEADHPARGWAASRHDFIRTRFEDAIAHSKKTGKISKDVNPHVLSTFILSAIEGVEAQWLINPKVDVIKNAKILHYLISTSLAKK